MKTVGRILIILAVAVAIAGVTLLAVNVSGAQASQSFGERQFSTGQEPNAGNSSSGLGQAGLAPGRFGSDSDRGGFDADRGGEGGGVFSLAEVLKNIAIVAVIVLIVTAVERLLKVIRRKRLAQVPVNASQPGRKE